MGRDFSNSTLSGSYRTGETTQTLYFQTHIEEQTWGETSQTLHFQAHIADNVLSVYSQ